LGNNQKMRFYEKKEWESEENSGTCHLLLFVCRILFEGFSPEEWNYLQ